jgi:hypothetical protein
MHRLQVNFDVIIDGRSFRIPAGYETDLGSIPWFAWPIILPSDPNFVAGFVFHDFGYQGELWPRWYMDRILLVGMRELGAKPWKRALVYSAVRISGGWTYRKHTDSSVKLIRESIGWVYVPGATPLWSPGFVPKRRYNVER